MKTTNLKEANEALAARSKTLHEAFEAMGADMDASKALDILGVKDTHAAAEKIKSLNDELSDIGQQRDNFTALQIAKERAERVYHDSHDPASQIMHPQDAPKREVEIKSIGRLFIESRAFKEFDGHKGPTAPLDLDIRNAVFRTGAGWLPESIRLPGYIPSAQEEPTVVDQVVMLPTSQTSVVFMLESTFTNTAAETAESTATTAADLIPEAALALTPTTQVVEWLPVFIPVTMQQMEDVDGIEAYVDDRLRLMLRQRLSSQILNGDGNTPNLKGTLNIGGSLQTQAVSTDPVPDAVYKLFTKLRVTGKVSPSVVFFHPNDWQPVRLLRTADGIYIWGSPMEAGPERIWGVRVVQTTEVVENTAIAGDYANYARLFVKRGITLAVSDSHAHYFTRGMLAIRADMRVAMVHYRTSAFGTITGV